jgi:hypothetical protein
MKSFQEGSECSQKSGCYLKPYKRKCALEISFEMPTGTPCLESSCMIVEVQDSGSDF